MIKTREDKIPADVIAPDRVSERTTPRQARSRNRQTVLLDEAETLIGEVGLDGLSMREVARRAGLPIASVYHYFPSAAAIVRAIALRQLERISEFVRGRLTQPAVEKPGEAMLATFASQLIAEVATFLSGIPAAPAIWAALRSNPELRTLDRADTLEIARQLVPYVRPLCHGGIDPQSMAVVILETVAVNLIFALESEEPMRTAHVTALQTFVAAAISHRS